LRRSESNRFLSDGWLEKEVGRFSGRT